MTTQNPAMLSPDQATTNLSDETKSTIPVFKLHFIPIDQHTTFKAEVAISEGDIIIHFFMNDEIRAMPNPEKYWKETFPNVLSATAEGYFNATYPKLKAAYTEEPGIEQGPSWWMRAYGFGHTLDPHKYAYGFFDALDAALDALLGNTPTHA